MPPKVFPCGGDGQPACPPVPASAVNEPLHVPEEEIIQAALLMSTEAKIRLVQLIAEEKF